MKTKFVQYCMKQLKSFFCRLDVQVRVFAVVLSVYFCFEYFPVFCEAISLGLPIKVEMTFRFVANTCFIALYLMMFYLPIYYWKRPILHPKKRND